MSRPDPRGDSRERWLQNVAFLGAAFVLALVLFTAFSMQRNRRALERQQVTVTPRTVILRPTRAPTVMPRAPTIPPTETPASSTSARTSYPYPRPDDYRSFPTGPANLWLLAETTGGLDPRQAGGNPVLQPALFLGLTMRSRYGGPSLPALAESVEFSSDRRVFTAYLRKDVFWVQCDPESGEVQRQRAVTAQDVVYTIEWAARTGTPAAQVAYLFPVAGVEARYLGDETADLGVEALDTYTVRFTLTTSLPRTKYFPSFTDLTVSWPVPREAIEQHGDAWTAPGNIWTSGPFCPIAWFPGRTITLVPNPWLPDDLRQLMITRVIPQSAALPRAPKPSPAAYPTVPTD